MIRESTFALTVREYAWDTQTARLMGDGESASRLEDGLIKTSIRFAWTGPFCSDD